MLKQVDASGFLTAASTLQAKHPMRSLLFQRLSSLVFPQHCSGCTQPIRPDQKLSWCRACLGRLQSDPSECCPRCGAEVKGGRFLEHNCRLCRGLKLSFKRAIAVGNYRDLMRQLIIDMKGRHLESLAYQMGLLLGQRLIAECGHKPFDAIVPIPMHWTKRFQRGFQASAVIADGVQHELRLPILLGCLKVVRRTAKQGTLETPERFRNVEGAFVVTNSKQLINKRLLVVDDVMTSGATISQVAKVLLTADAMEVNVGIVARGARVS